jgi:hypothetical protein
MTGWLTDAFIAFLRSLSPFSVPAGDPTPAGGWGQALLGVWLPDLAGLTGAGFGWILAFTAGLGAAIALWYAGPALLTSIATGDIKAIGQAFIGLTAVTVSAPVTLWIAQQLRTPVLETAQGLAGEIAATAVTQTLEGMTLLPLLMMVLASITYLIAGMIGGYAYIVVAALAPIAASSLVFRSGTSPFFKWLAWFLTLLLAPMWVAIALGAAGYLAEANSALGLNGFAMAVGVIIAAAAPFTMLALIGKVVPHGGGADSATRIGSGQTIGSAVAYSAPRVIK